MNKIIYSLLILSFVWGGCRKLDLNPLSEGSSENWFSNEKEIELALNDLYRPELWYVEACRAYNLDRYTDDWSQREQLYEYASGTITSDWADAKDTWINSFKAIARANTILNSLDKVKGSVPEVKRNQFKGEASFFRAAFYSYLVFLYGNVPLMTKNVSIDEAFSMGRTDKNMVLQQIYSDFDTAVKYLRPPAAGLRRITDGAAYAFKARVATWMLDYKTARDAAKSCMNLNEYSLDPEYRRMFLASANSSPEFIFLLPQSMELTGTEAFNAKSFVPRYAGGNNVAQPSWELFCSYLCTDGLPVDKSPRYNPQNPFKNRDPRLYETIVEFGTPWLGYIYDPGTAQTLEIATGKMVSNKESQLSDQFAPYNGLCLKKGVDETWADDYLSDNNWMVMRYADVLLMYAEAKMELNEIDQSVFDALNSIRARAYKVPKNAIALYPAVSATDQDKLRTIIRMERRVELAWENRRYFDLIRWRLMEIANKRPVVALPQKPGLTANISSGDYFFPKGALPIVEDNGLVNLQPIINTGKVRTPVKRDFQAKEYLWPIPTEEITINPNLLPNNPGYGN